MPQDEEVQGMVVKANLVATPVVIGSQLQQDGACSGAPFPVVPVKRSRFCNRRMAATSGLAFAIGIFATMMLASAYYERVTHDKQTNAPQAQTPQLTGTFALPADVDEPVAIELTLAATLDFAAPGTQAHSDFVAQLVHGIASAAQVSADRFCCVALRAGSVVATVTILPGMSSGEPSPTELVATLAAALAADPDAFGTTVVSGPTAIPAEEDAQEQDAIRARIIDQLAEALGVSPEQLTIVTINGDDSTARVHFHVTVDDTEELEEVERRSQTTNGVDLQQEQRSGGSRDTRGDRSDEKDDFYRECSVRQDGTRRCAWHKEGEVGQEEQEQGEDLLQEGDTCFRSCDRTDGILASWSTARIDERLKCPPTMECTSTRTFRSNLRRNTENLNSCRSADTCQLKNLNTAAVVAAPEPISSPLSIGDVCYRSCADDATSSGPAAFEAVDLREACPTGTRCRGPRMSPRQRTLDTCFEPLKCR